MKFVKGQSGNPSGRPNKARTEFVDRLVKDGFVDKALEVIKNELGSNVNKRFRFPAAIYILDQVYGKPKQAIEHSGDLDVNGGFRIEFTTENNN